jgi:hypothetical protein
MNHRPKYRQLGHYCVPEGLAGRISGLAILVRLGKNLGGGKAIALASENDEEAQREVS